MVAGTFVLLLAFLSVPQIENSFYIESWKEGKKQIQQQSFKITLTSKERKFETKLKDSSGKERYKLSVQLRENEDLPPSGFVFLFEKTFWGFQDTNLLKPSNDPYQDAVSKEDVVSVLVPIFVDGRRSRSVAVGLPYLMKRIIKVESFYCILQVTHYDQSPVSMTVIIEFTNSFSK